MNVAVQNVYVPNKWKLPIYGPLQIKNLDDFLDKESKQFLLFFRAQFPYQKPIDSFKILYEIGRGSFGVVALVKSAQYESYYAMKVLQKRALVEKNRVDRAMNEKMMLQSLNCPFTIFLVYFSQDKINIYYILPFICAGDLHQLLRRLQTFSSNLSRFYAAQIVLALQYLHRCNVVYRDLKPENIMLDHTGFIKVTDFGMAKLVPKRTYTFCGTPDFMAPEVIKGSGYGKAVDWWSLGVLIYELKFGKTPFHNANVDVTFKSIMNVKYYMPIDFSQKLKDLVDNLLQHDVSRRLGNLKSGVEGIKKHEWFKEVDWLALFNRQVIPPFIPSDTQSLNSKLFPDMRTVSSSEFVESPKEDEYTHVFAGF